MNKNFHRVIFNAARRMRMVVQETARSVGKSTGTSTRMSSPRSTAVEILVFIASLTAISAAAQIASDRNAPANQRPTVLVAPNGVPLVNIRAPSAAGVSRNTYRQFDVDGNGAILNNSRTNVQTQLGGYVQGNPWLVAGSARVIVNEVNSSNPSYLRGFVEVAGPRSEVIIANPSGIFIDGGGFINANRATLTTGVPQFGPSGDLESYIVRSGTVGILGAGLDASTTDSLAILARAFELSGALHATELKVVAGANQVSTDLTGITPIDGTGNAPAYAIDVAQLGGMYANHIALIVNENGVGARNAGTIQTSTGTYALAGAGKLTLSVEGLLENSGLIQTSSDATIRAANLANSGTVQSAASLTIATQGDLANHIAGAGGTLEGQRVELSSTAGDIDNRAGTIRQTSAAALTVTGPNLSNTNAGFIGAEPVVASGGGSSSSSTTTPVVVSPGTLNAAGHILNDGGKVYAGDIVLQTPDINNDGGTINVANLAVSGPSFSNAGGTLNVKNTFAANVGTLNNAGGRLHAGTIGIATTSDLNNQGGTLVGDGAVNLDVAGSLNNTLGSIQSAGSSASLTIANQLLNDKGSIGAGTDLAIQTGSLSNTGATATIRAENDSTVAVIGVLSNDARITAGRNATVTAGTLNGSASGVLGAGVKADGTLATAGDLGITTTGALTAAGSVVAAGNASLHGANVDLSGSNTSGANIALTATSGDVTTRQATVTTPGSLRVTANATSGQSLVNQAGTLSAGQLDLHASNIQNTNAGQIVQTGTGPTAITVTGTLDNTGGTTASNGQDLTLTAATLRNTGGTVKHSGSGTMGIAATTFSGASGTLVGNGALTVQAGSFNQDGGSTSAKRVTIDAADLSNVGGSIVQTGAGTTHIAATSSLVNDGGIIASNGADLNVSAGALFNANGNLQHAGIGSLNLAANSYDGAGGEIITNGALVANVAGAFDQSGGTTTAKQITIDASSIGNVGGTLTQTGTDATRIATTGTLDNTAGRIASNGQDLTLAAATLLNTAGTVQHAGTGTLDIGAAQAFSGAKGQIASNGALNAHGGDFDLDGGTTSAAQISVNTDSLSNRAGQIVQTGTGATLIATVGNIVNDGGTIATNANDVKLAAGGTLSNADGHLQHAGTGAMNLTAGNYAGARGEIVSNGALRANVAGAFDQSAGTTSAKQVAIDAGSLGNVGGALTQTGTAATHISTKGDLNNDGGTIATNAVDVEFTAGGTLSNAAGKLQHAGTGKLNLAAGAYSGAKGELVTNGALVASVAGAFGQDGGSTSASQVTIDAGSLSNVAGDIAQTGSGATRISTTGTLDNTAGRIGSNGSDVTLAAATLQNTGGTLQHAGTGALNITASTFSGANGSILGNGALSVQTGAFHQDGGSTSAHQISIDATDIGNVGGSIVQTGTGTTHIAATGALSNDGGTIASNGADLNLTAGGTLSNADGHLQHAGTGTLNLAAGSYSGASGEITTNNAFAANVAGAFDQDGGSTSARQLTLRAGSLSNRGGEIVQTGTAAATVAVAGALDNNANGSIASNGDLTVTAASLINRGGSVRAAGTASLDLITTGLLDNSNTGAIGAAGNAVLRAGSLLNDAGSVTAAGELTATVSGAASNVGGTLAANGNTTVSAASLDNTFGTVAAVTGDLAVTTSGTTTNTQGALQSAGRTSLTNTGLANTQGKVTGNALSVNTNGNALDNTLGTLAGTTTVDLQTGVLNNDKGLVQSGGAMTFDTHGQSLANTNATGHSSGQGGIASGGSLAVNAGAVDNSAGFIGAAGAITASTGSFTNTASGVVLGKADVAIAKNGALYDNRGGKTLALGNLMIDVGNGEIQNSGALIRSAGTTTLAASTVDNSATLGTDQGVEGKNIAIAAATLNNDGGAIRADVNATITSAGTVSNTNGLISAGDTLAILDPKRANPSAKRLAVINTGGTLTAGKSLQLDAATFSADGTLTSGQDLSIALTQNLVNNATVSANRNLTYATTGTLTNNGKLLAGNVLTVSGSDVENTATGEMRGDTTIVKAGGTLRNRGLIDGRDTQVDAGAVRNIGTGRIYGDRLSIAAGTVDNLAETVNGDTKAGTLSARERLDIGAQTVRNRDGALVFSGGDLFIGGALDANRQATGSAALLENKAATIEALNNVGITASTLNNLNGGVTWHKDQTMEQVIEFAPPGSTQRWKASDVLIASFTAAGWTAVPGFAPDTNDNNAGTRLLIPSPLYPLAKFATYYAKSPAPSNDSSYQMPTGIADEVVTVAVPGAWYGSADPIWAAFGIAAPVRDLPADNPIRLDRDLTVGQTATQYGKPLDHPVTQAEYDEAQTYYAAHTALDQATQKFVDTVYAGTTGPGVAAFTPNGFYRDYSIWMYTATTDSPVLSTSAPARIVSGGDMTLTVGSGAGSTNDMSQILAGRTLTVTGGTIANKPVEVLATTAVSGTALTTEVVNHTFSSSKRRYDPAPFDLVIPPKTVTLAAARQEGNQNATSGKAPGTSTFSPTGANTSAAGAVDAGNRVSPIVEVPSAVGGSPGVAGALASVANAGNGSGVTGGSAGSASANGATSAAATPIGNSAGMSAGTASGSAASASTPASGVTRTGASASQSLVVRTTTSDARIPTASLFRTLPGSASHYLIETDPAFASYRNWLSSDYLLNALSYDPATVIKRLGDGFYEQRLIREQVAQLTGYRYLEGSKNDQDQYTALMNSGATFAQAYQLTPGIALSAAQMAQLTSDIVWLVEQTVTLADGSTQKVLVPQVYVRVKPGDIDGSGALLSADTLVIKNQPGHGDVINSGTIAGRTMVSITADNVRNLNGRISGGRVGIEARNDLNSIGGTIDAKNAVSLKAGRDITIASTTQTAVGAKSSATALDRVAGVYVTNPGGTLVANAGHDVNLIGAILSNAGVGGMTSIKAVNDINLGTVKTGSSQDTTWNAKNYSRSESAEVGSSIITNGTTVLNAGNDINLRQATIDASTGLLSIHADRNVTLAAGQSTQSAEEARSSKKSGFLTSKTTTTRSTSDETLSHGTSLSGGLVSITATGNITGEGVKINGTDGVLVHANGSLDLHEARDVRSESNSVSVKKSGFAGSVGGIPLPVGSGRRGDSTSDSNTAVASTVTSQNGGVLLQGDGAAILRGVKVDAAEDVTIKGGAVSITAATNYASNSSESYTRGTKIDASLVHDLGKGIDAKNTDKGERQISTLARTTLSGANVTITATGADGKGGLMTMTGTTVNTPGALTFNADKLILGTQTTQVDTSNTSQGGDAAWIKNKGEGASDQTTNYNQFNVGTLVTPVNSVQIGLGARDSVESLAKQPGMAWVNQIANDPKLAGKVDWTKVEEAHSQWDYKQQSLTPAAAAVITLVVAYFTAGAASGLGATAGNAAAVSAGQGVALAGGGAFVSAGAGVAISSVVGGAVTAGVSALASQAAVAMINNKGDIGGVLNDLGSSANVHGLLTAIATGGVLGGLNLNPTGLPTEGSGAQKFMDQLGQNLQAGAAKAVIGTAIDGGSLEDSLKSTLKTALLDTMAAQSANSIGDITAGDGTLDKFANKVAHAIAGCAVGAARTDTSGGCGAGAIGAAVGEIAAEAYGKKSDTTQFAAMVAGIAAATTGASAAEINLASQGGANAAANNYLSHDEQAMRKKAQTDCYSGSTASCTELARLNNLDAQRDLRVKNLADNCTVDCVQVLKFVNDELTALGCTGSVLACDDATLRKAWQIVMPKAEALQPGFGPDDALLLAYSLTRSGIKLITTIASTGKEVPVIVADSLSSTPAAIARQINNLYRDGAPPELIQQAVLQAAKSSTQNAGASEVVLGRYIAGSTDSYEAVAQTRGATYFSMSDWSTVQGQMGAEKMWNINKSFLDQQMKQDKTFIFTENPSLARPGSYTQQEYRYLLDSGYDIQPLNGGFYSAVKR